MNGAIENTISRTHGYLRKGRFREFGEGVLDLIEIQQEAIESLRALNSTLIKLLIRKELGDDRIIENKNPQREDECDTRAMNLRRRSVGVTPHEVQRLKKKYLQQKPHKPEDQTIQHDDPSPKKATRKR